MSIFWKLEKRKVSELKPYPKNPRIFTEKGMRDLNNSIDKIGMAQPINITLDGTVLSGHARLYTLQRKGVEEVDVYVPDRELTDDEQREVVIRMNANTAGEWDFDMLANEFELPELMEWGLDLNIEPPELPEINEPVIEEELLECPCCHCQKPKKDFKSV